MRRDPRKDTISLIINTFKTVGHHKNAYYYLVGFRAHLKYYQ